MPYGVIAWTLRAGYPKEDGRSPFRELHDRQRTATPPDRLPGRTWSAVKSVVAPQSTHHGCAATAARAMVGQSPPYIDRLRAWQPGHRDAGAMTRRPHPERHGRLKRYAGIGISRADRQPLTIPWLALPLCRPGAMAAESLDAGQAGLRNGNARQSAHRRAQGPYALTDSGVQLCPRQLYDPDALTVEHHREHFRVNTQTAALADLASRKPTALYPSPYRDGGNSCRFCCLFCRVNHASSISRSLHALRLHVTRNSLLRKELLR